MISKKTRYRRTQFLSNPKVQIKIILVFAVLGILYAGTNYYIAKSTLWSVTSDILRLPLSGANRDDVNLLINQQCLTLDMQLGLFTTLVVTVLILAGVFMSHRLGGPIYQLTTYLAQMTEGTVVPRRIRFRKQDFFHDLADRFNSFQESQGIVPPQEAGKTDAPESREVEAIDSDTCPHATS